MLKGQDLTPAFGAHACARSALRARQRRWRPQHRSPRELRCRQKLLHSAVLAGARGDILCAEEKEHLVREVGKVRF